MTQRGFTLIEVVVASTILAALTITVMQNIQTGLKTKEKIHEEIEDMSAVRDGLRVMEKDINLAYHYRDIEMEFLAQVKCRLAAQATPSNTPPPGAPPPLAPPPTASPPANGGAPNQACLTQFMTQAKTDPKFQFRLDPTTQFVGKADSLDFVTMNVGRVSENQKFADFAKVGYALKSCRDLNGKSSGKCLVRRFSPKVEGDVTKGGEESVLIENVSELKFRYIGKGKLDWVDEWSTLGQDASAANNFPSAVEISLATEKEKTVGKSTKKKKISMQLVAAIRFPNNQSTDPGQSGGTSGGAPGQAPNNFQQAPLGR